jgi:MFS family permease
LCFYIALPIFLRSYVGLPSSLVFVIYVGSSLMAALTYRMAGRLVTEVGGKKVQSLAASGRIILFPSFFLVTLIPMAEWTIVLVFVLLHALVGLCWAGLSVAGSALVSNLSYKDFRAEGMGMYNATQGLASIAGSIIGGFVAQLFGFLPTFLVASGFLLIAILTLRKIDVDTPISDIEGPRAKTV